MPMNIGVISPGLRSDGQSLYFIWPANIIWKTILCDTIMYCVGCNKRRWFNVVFEDKFNVIGIQ